MLQGIVVCGRCGHRMHATYPKGGHPRYVCASPIHRGLASHVCWSVSAPGVDEVVVNAFLEAVGPAEVDLALAVACEAGRQAETVDAQWRLALERAQYEARLAERRYKAVDPDHRVVARTLEREWNEKLADLDRLERARDEARRAHKTVLTDADRRQIVTFCHDLPRVWAAPTTTVQEKKNLLRTLVQEVALRPVEGPTPATQVRVLWVTGTIGDYTVPLPQRGGTRASPEADALIRRRVAEGVPAGRIASELVALELRTGDDHPWTKAAVHSYCLHHGIRWPTPMPTSVPAPHRRDDGLYSLRGVAEAFGVSPHVVRYWIKLGWLVPENGRGRGRPAWFHLDDAVRDRIRRLVETHGALGRPDDSPTVS